jgi:2-dehydro-3-deoxygluconokinase
MLRLDPGDLRVKTAREFRVWEGGGEYNVARGLRRCFGLRTAIVTALADNSVGRLVEDLILQGGVDVSQVRWVPYDGLGRTVRNGLNFTERGFGIRGAQGVSDRGQTAASQLKPGDIDWEHLFGTLGARWFHTGGIYAGLSETTPEVIEAAMTTARRHGTVVSYDLNYRPSLWKSYGGQRRAQEVNRALARHVDVMIGNEEDFTACLGFAVPNTGGDLTGLEAENFKAMIGQVTAEFGFSVVATTLRGVISATVNDWGAIAWSAESRFVEATHRPALEIYDRVGGGDSFASGLIYGLLTTGDLQRAVDYGAAHGALAMTTPGDTSMASLAEVEPLVAGAGARVQRLSICYDHATVGLDRRQSGGKLFTSPNKPDAPNWVSATGGELAWRRW